MKKIIFVESRYVTYLYDEIAKKLIQNGYEVFWIILNHQFKPKNGKIVLLDYPGLKKTKAHKNNYIETVIKTDRQLRFFDKKSKNHFYHYDLKIRKAIEEIQPSLVFGEPTAFHHLISIEICKELDILYLHPGTCRYPINRFAFYKYDTLEPYKGSGDHMSKEKAIKTINQISGRETVPDYMIPPRISYKEKVVNKAKVLIGYIEGERNNTPSPFVKLIKERKNKHVLEEWNSIGKHALDTSKFITVFPIHMQPESSIDVWGRKYSDQNKVIENISKQLKDGEVLYVKPNPKSSFEINKELINIINNNDKIEALHSTVKMNDIFDKVDLFINVVGTIAIECILSNKPVISLVKTYFNNTKNSYNIGSYDEIRFIIETVISKKNYKFSNEEKIEFINTLNAFSYEGIIADTYLNKNCINPDNVNRLYKAFLDVL